MDDSILQQQGISLTSYDNPPSRYSTERSFSAAKFDETLWDKLLPSDAESYRLHLAFEMGKIRGFKVGYIAIKRSGVIVCIAPYFVTDYALETTVQGNLKTLLCKVREYAPRLFNIRILCVGSAVTDSCKIGMLRDYPFDPEMLKALCAELEIVAKREGASVVAFKDVIEGDAVNFAPTLKSVGFGQVTNMPVATNLINYKDFDEYLASLSYVTRKGLRRKMKSLEHLRIEEFDGLPPNMEAVYQLYLETFDRSDLQFEKLTQEFFEAIPGLMPNNTRFVLYYAEDQLIAFNLIVHRDGVMLDKYIGMHKGLAKKYNIYFISWLHNIKMCIRDGFHTYQSGQATYETKLHLGAKLKQTYIFFRHRNRLLNQPLKLLANALAYANFDSSVK